MFSIGLLKPRIRIFIMVICIWNAIISVSNAKIISRQSGLRAIKAYNLRQISWKTAFSIVGRSTRLGPSVLELPLYLKRSLRYFWEKALGNLIRLLAMSGPKCEETSSTIKKKSKNRLYTLNISSQFYWSLKLIVFHQKASYVLSFMTG